MIKQVVILGAGGFAREVVWAIREANKVEPRFELLGYIDENRESHGQVLCDLPVLGGFDWLDGASRVWAICGVGSPRTKKAFVQKAKAKGVDFVSVVFPNVVMSEYVSIGEGSIICAGCTVTTQVSIHDHVILNLDCSVGHDAIIEDYCTLAPGTQVSGYSHIHQGVDIGTGTNIIPGISIGEWSIIGAGASVARDIPPHVTAVGVPAKVIKQHN